MSDKPNVGLFWASAGKDDQSAKPLRPPRPTTPFPLSAFPDTLFHAFEDVARLTQAPDALIACSMLGVISACSQGVVDVKRDESLKLVGPVGLFVLVVARSGERKTTVDKLLTRAIAEWERAQREAFKPIYQEYLGELKNWESVDAGLRDAQRKASRDGAEDPALREQIIEHENMRPAEPKAPAILRGDDTPEAFAQALSRWPIAYCVSSEGGLVFGGPGMSRDSVMRNLSQYNLAWDGGPIKRARVTGQNVDIEGIRCTICWQVQPEVLSSFQEDAGQLARGMGFVARFLACEPVSTQGDRMFQSSDDDTPGLLRFEQRVKELLALPVQLDAHGRVVPFQLALSEEARAEWIAYHDSVEMELGTDGRFERIQDVASKSAEQAARIAACLHMFKSSSPSGEIEHDSMRGGIAIARWFLNEALSVNDHTIIPEAFRNAELLEEWLAKQHIVNLKIPVNSKEIIMRGPGPLRNKRSRDDALDILENHNRIQVTGRTDAVSTRSFNVSLTPELCEEWRRKLTRTHGASS
jgi:putative DNA primase/helicase